MSTRSVPFGSIYATERFFHADPPLPKELRALRRAVRTAVASEGRSEALYGVGGAIRNLARMIRVRRNYPVTRLHGTTITRGDLRRLTRALVGASEADRRKLPGMNPERVATLPAAAVVVEEVMDAAGVSSLVVSGQGLREGLLWQASRGRDAVLPDVRGASVAGLAAANGVDLAQGGRVARIAARLFDATRPAHQLPADDRELLVHAGSLADMGAHVDYYNRDRHAEYLVHSGALLGFDHREVVVLASIVRWSLAGTPALGAYRGVVEPGDAFRVQALAGLLGVARAICRRRPSPVAAVDAALDGNTLRIRLGRTAAVDAEEYALERQLQRLESALKVSVQLDVASPA